MHQFEEFQPLRSRLSRRAFVATGVASLIAPQLAGATVNKRRAVAIGHTGRGNFGHGLDAVWTKLPEAELVAIADANPAGLKKTTKKLGISAGYDDYRQMLREEQPEFVSICPRHPDQHHDMILAAIEAGAKGLYVEKPFCRTPAEADAIIKASKEANVRIAVAHRNRYHPTLPAIKAVVENGDIGTLLEMRGRGLGDHRGGSEDLWVLGGHIFNLMEYFAGPAVTCSATVLKDGHPIVASDVMEGNESLGPLAGDEVHARYRTASGLTAYYDSKANSGTRRRAYALKLIGSDGFVSVFIDKDPLAYFSPGNPFAPETAANRDQQRWIPISTNGVGQAETASHIPRDVANHVLAVRDLISACDENRAPLCSATNGAMTVEMISAVFESHRSNSQEVAIPLANRGFPLASW